MGCFDVKRSHGGRPIGGLFTIRKAIWNYGPGYNCKTIGFCSMNMIHYQRSCSMHEHAGLHIPWPVDGFLEPFTFCLQTPRHRSPEPFFFFAFSAKIPLVPEKKDADLSSVSSTRVVIVQGIHCPQTPQATTHPLESRNFPDHGFLSYVKFNHFLIMISSSCLISYRSSNASCTFPKVLDFLRFMNHLHRLLNIQEPHHNVSLFPRAFRWIF